MDVGQNITTSDGSLIGCVTTTTKEEYEKVIEIATSNPLDFKSLANDAL